MQESSNGGTEVRNNVATKQHGFAKGNPHRFKKGDPRCNRKGRPRSYDYARALAQKIADESLELKDGRKITVAEAVLRQWAKSPEPTLQKAFVEYAFGKVPDKLETTGLENKTSLVLHFDHEKGVTRE